MLSTWCKYFVVQMTTDRILLNSVELCQQNRKPLKEISLTSGSQLDLESQLQDVRKAVTVMQVLLV